MDIIILYIVQPKGFSIDGDCDIYPITPQINCEWGGIFIDFRT